MDIILSEKTNDEVVFHPVMLKIVKNDKSKNLTVPHGKTNNLSDQSYFTKKNHTLNTDSNNVFFSHDYFFLSCFNASTFEEKMKLLKEILEQNYQSETIGYILKKMMNTFIDLSDKQINELVELYSIYDKKYQNKNSDYSELFKQIESKINKNKLKQNK